MTVKPGDVMLYCAVESALNSDFLRLNNLYDVKEMNNNSDQKGYINKRGRVRAIKLRGENSAGLLLPLDSIETWLGEKVINPILNEDFDMINGQQFSQKYIPPRVEYTPHDKTNKRNNKLKRFDRLVENQFNFHIDTEQLAKHLHEFQLEDLIQISSKWHGTSCIVSNIMVNRKLNWFEKLLLRVGVKIRTTEYGNIYASRTVIKNQYINPNNQGYYSVDVWKEANDRIKIFLKEGMTIYCEIVGHLPGSQQYIQKPFDYGCEDGEFKIYIYRITITNPTGSVYEFSTQQVQEWCKNQGLIPVKQLFYGTVQQYLDKYNIDSTDEEWRKLWYVHMANNKDYNMEKNDPDCKMSVPFEGLVIRKESLKIHSYKLKTQAFLQKESKALDEGELSIEDIS